MPRPSIEHVFVLMLENRSFDHMLGFSGIAGFDAVTGESTELRGLKGDESNEFDGVKYTVSKGVPASMPFDPGHEFENVLEQLVGPDTPPKLPAGGAYPPVNLSGFVSSYARSGGAGDPGEILKCFDPAQLPVLVELARQFAVCDNWFSSMPGPTWPNRFFAVAGTSGGLDHSPSSREIGEWELIEGFKIEHGTIFDRRDLATRIYCGGILCIAQTLKNIDFRDVHPYATFAGDISSAAQPYAPKFTLIEPDYGDFLGPFTGGTSQHPLDSVTGGERLIKEVYETIRNSALWEKSLLIVTWDEHGGFYDHVVPPPAVAPGDRIVNTDASHFGFDFRTCGPRVPAVVISPYTAKNRIDHRLYDHTSILATVRELFGGEALTARDAAASLMPLVSLDAARDDAPLTLPGPVDQPIAANRQFPPADGPVHGSNLPGFLAAALRSHLVMAADHERDAIFAAVSALNTRAEACDYIKRVEQMIGAHRSGQTARGASR